MHLFIFAFVPLPSGVSDCKDSTFLRIVQVLAAKSFPNAIFWDISQSIGKYGKLTKGVYGTLFVRKGACAQPPAHSTPWQRLMRHLAPIV
jgi:hypothetical protein